MTLARARQKINRPPSLSITPTTLRALAGHLADLGIKASPNDLHRAVFARVSRPANATVERAHVKPRA